MKRMQSLLFQRFGKWKVLALEPEHHLKTQETVWRCMCECGVVEAKAASALKRGATKGCKGCATTTRWQQYYAQFSADELAALKHERLLATRAQKARYARARDEERRQALKASGTYAPPKNLIGMIGAKCNKWTVIGGPTARKKHIAWECRCDCGTVALVQGYRLRSGTSKQCRFCASKIAQPLAAAARRKKPSADVSADAADIRQSDAAE